MVTRELSTQPEESPAAERASKPEAAATGSGYRASVTGVMRSLWSCAHVHFTEHSARACAEEHLRAWPLRPQREAGFVGEANTWLERGRVEAGDLKPGVVAGSGGYRAIITGQIRKSWSCPHVHFTDHSARACAERHLRI